MLLVLRFLYLVLVYKLEESVRLFPVIELKKLMQRFNCDVTLSWLINVHPDVTQTHCRLNFSPFQDGGRSYDIITAKYKKYLRFNN